METNNQFLIEPVQGGYRVGECVGIHDGVRMMITWDTLHTTPESAAKEVNRTTGEPGPFAVRGLLERPTT